MIDDLTLNTGYNACEKFNAELFPDNPELYQLKMVYFEMSLFARFVSSHSETRVTENFQR